MYKVLLVEDVIENQNLVKIALKDLCSITIAPNLQSAKGFLTTENYDLFLIDLHLPDGDGSMFMSHLQSEEKYKNNPKIVFSTKQTTEDRILCFQLGADDYITKPVNLNELRVRIEAKLKKLQQNMSSVIDLTPLFIYKESHKVVLKESTEEKELPLSPTEYKILLVLVENLGKIQSRDILVEKVWGKHIHVSDRSIDIHISSIRKKLKSQSLKIRTIYGVGYIFDPRSKTVSE